MKPLFIFAIVVALMAPIVTHPTIIGERKGADILALFKVEEQPAKVPAFNSPPPAESQKPVRRAAVTERLVTALGSVKVGQPLKEPTGKQTADEAGDKSNAAERLVEQIRQKANKAAATSTVGTSVRKPATNKVGYKGRKLKHLTAGAADLSAQAQAPAKKDSAGRETRVSLLNRKELRRIGELVDNKQLPATDLFVEFAYKSAHLSDKALPVLRQLGAALTDGRLKGSAFIVAGHTDAVGSDGYNQKLSLRRAHAVRDFLRQNFNLLEEQLVAVGYGEQRLKNKAEPKADENRRVEFVNLVTR